MYYIYCVIILLHIILLCIMDLLCVFLWKNAPQAGFLCHSHGMCHFSISLCTCHANCSECSRSWNSRGAHGQRGMHAFHKGVHGRHHNSLQQEADRPKSPRQAQLSTPPCSQTCEITKSLSNQGECSQSEDSASRCLRRTGKEPWKSFWRVVPWQKSRGCHG